MMTQVVNTPFTAQDKIQALYISIVCLIIASELPGEMPFCGRSYLIRFLDTIME